MGPIARRKIEMNTKNIKVKIKSTYPWPINEYKAVIHFDKPVSVEEFKKFLREEFPKIEIRESD